MAERLPSDLDLSGIIRPGAHIVLGHACGEPITLTQALVAQRAALGGVSLFMASAFSATFKPEHADHIRFSSMGAIGTLARLSRAGVLDIIPSHVGQLGAFMRQGLIPCDVAMIQVSAPGPDGTYSLGLINDHVQAAIETADVVIAEISDQVPWTHCDRHLTLDDIDWYVETSRPPVEVKPGEPGEADQKIAGFVGGYIYDGSTLQLGIGAVPDAVTRLLGDRRDLGIHSGMIGEGVMELMEKGVVTNARKPIEPGVTVTGAMVGSARFYRFLDRNAQIGVRRSEVTHGTEVLAALPNLVTINSAIEVDLTGQVNAEQTGTLYLGGTGGQVDYVRAGARSQGGRSIIALPATAKGGELSRIVTALSGPVSTARAEADVIVTEFGAAELKGKSIRDRVAAMIAIAHPAFREELERSAHEMMKRGF